MRDKDELAAEAYALSRRLRTLSSDANEFSWRLNKLGDDTMAISCPINVNAPSCNVFDCETFLNSLRITNAQNVEIYPNGVGEIPCDGQIKTYSTWQKCGGGPIDDSFPVQLLTLTINGQSIVGTFINQTNGTDNQIDFNMSQFNLSGPVNFATLVAGQFTGDPSDLCSVPLTVSPCPEKSFPSPVNAPIETPDWPLQPFPGPGQTTIWNVGDGTDQVELTCLTTLKKHFYSKRNAINCDNTKILMYGYNQPNGPVCVIDLNDPNATETVLNFNSEVSFSTSNPNLIWGMAGGVYTSYDCSTGIYTPYPNMDGQTLGDFEGRPSHNDQFVNINSGNQIEYWIVGQTTPVFSITQPANYNWSGVSTNGNYLVVQDDTGLPHLDIYDSSGNYLYTHTGPVNGIEHSDVGLDCNGREILVSVGEGEPYFMDLQTGKVYKWDLTDNAVEPRMLVGHVSGIASVKRQGYFYFSDSGALPSLDTAAMNDLFALQACPTNIPTTFDRDQGYTNGGRGICEAASNQVEWWGSSTPLNDPSYWLQPKATVSPDGTTILTTGGNSDYLVKCI